MSKLNTFKWFLIALGQALAVPSALMIPPDHVHINPRTHLYYFVVKFSQLQHQSNDLGCSQKSDHWPLQILVTQHLVFSIMFLAYIKTRITFVSHQEIYEHRCCRALGAWVQNDRSAQKAVQYVMGKCTSFVLQIYNLNVAGHCICMCYLCEEKHHCIA